MCALWVSLLVLPAGASGFCGAPAGMLRPAAGRFLVADEKLADPNFARSVVLLLDKDADGAMGVIVNRPTPLRVAHVLPEYEPFEHRGDVIYIGGPVAREAVLVLFRGDEGVAGARRVFDDIFFTGRPAGLRRLAERVPEDRLRIYSGYAGWAPGQLEGEIARGDWHVERARAEDVFSADPAGLWERLRSPRRGKWVREWRSPPAHWGAPPG